MGELPFLVPLLVMVAAAIYATATSAERGRRTDLLVLWPIFKKQAADLEHARNGFIVHMGMDPAWREHCRDWTEEQFGDFVREHLK